MTESWQDIKWIFEPDSGTSRDIYVQETTIEDWAKVIDLLNTEYSVCYDLSDGQRIKRPIDKEYSLSFLRKESEEMEFKSAAVEIRDIEIRTHFFDEDEIEFDLDPEDVNSIQDVQQVVNFMQRLSETLDKQVILTQENNANFPNIKVDANRGVFKILTEKNWKNSLKNQLFWIG